MSVIDSGASEVVAGLDYARLKQFFDADDYVSMAYSATMDYYVVGTMAALNDINVIDITKGWSPFAHQQPNAPIWWTTLGLPASLFLSVMPAFEAKTLTFLSSTDCYISFGGPLRVPHRIPANTFMTFRRRCFIFFVQQAVAPGNLTVWIEG